MALPKRELTATQSHEPVLTPEAKRTLRDLNFKVPPDFKKDFARQAVEEEVSQVELLRRMWKVYARTIGQGANSRSSEHANT